LKRIFLVLAVGCILGATIGTIAIASSKEVSSFNVAKDPHEDHKNGTTTCWNITTNVCGQPSN